MYYIVLMIGLLSCDKSNCDKKKSYSCCSKKSTENAQQTTSQESNAPEIDQKK